MAQMQQDSRHAAKSEKPAKPTERADAVSAYAYQSGFGNQFASEVVPGALPLGRNSPQRAPFGLYAELISGTAFTAPRHENRRTWLYRRQPSVVHRPDTRIDNARAHRRRNDAEATPDPLRWNPFPIPEAPTDFVDGLHTLAATAMPTTQIGIAVARLWRQPLDGRRATSSTPTARC